MSTRVVKYAMSRLVLVLGAATAQASIITVNFNFSDSSWSDTASFDDTTGQESLKN